MTGRRKVSAADQTKEKALRREINHTQAGQITMTGHPGVSVMIRVTRNPLTGITNHTPEDHQAMNAHRRVLAMNQASVNLAAQVQNHANVRVIKSLKAAGQDQKVVLRNVKAAPVTNLSVNRQVHVMVQNLSMIKLEPTGMLRQKPFVPKKPTVKDDGLIRLNRYIANAGICSRRKADDLIIAGTVTVNGEVVSELGSKIDPMKDEIRYNGETLKREKMTYVLLNKPKDYITTTDDPQERRTVMHLVEKASRERIYPIGRLDRNTTGLLLMTNDGDLADKLSHPRSNITKLYQVELNKNLIQGDLNKLQFGLELEDGPIKPDSVSYVAGGSKREIGIQIHSGKNRIVRRMFEHLGYEVVKLDRVVYANLTKKDLPRGRWRYLEEQEIIQLKHLIK